MKAIPCARKGYTRCILRSDGTILDAAIVLRLKELINKFGNERQRDVWISHKLIK